MSIPRFLTAINGIAQLWAADGQFLGLLSSDQSDPNSISNFYGNYGSSCGIYSIRNSAGLYGSESGIYSPYNTCCLNPPITFYQGQPVLMVTRNPYVQTNGLPVIDPDFLLGVYAQLSNSPNLFYSDPMEQLNQARRDYMQALNTQSAMIASMFH
ncbi:MULTISPECIES: hypothetical protein [Nostoc]|uniref:Uncharacterized protein n=1 Tax=Nostoc paludosum FACHB-159 TaxID=2692908 RepID=A0ABR8KI95_9NOSO|nr:MULTISPECIES: hypothetical protein [Nostoc]MBD2682193.1 hypothetical protein [Nostoc sp. FACHB-857]MBD2738521.1 hypothetical protein [Nostoc paludosum FACHB-159]